MSKKKIKKCSYYSGVESWKTKKRQKRDYDKQKMFEAFEPKELEEVLDKVIENIKDVSTALAEAIELISGE